MKFRLLQICCLLIVLCYILSACNKKKEPAIEESQESIRYFNCLAPKMTKAGSTLYYLDTKFNRMLYSDLENNTSGVLCGKPECLHEDEKCNAYLGITQGLLSYYNEKIYWQEWEEEDQSERLLRMDKNGENHEKVLILASSNTDDSFPRGNTFFQIMDGYAVATGINNKVIDGEMMIRNQITLYDLDTGKHTIVFQNEYSTLRSCVTAQYYQGDIYYSISTDTALNPGLLKEDAFARLYRYNIKKRETELIYEVCPANGIYFYEFTVYDNKIWFITNLEAEDTTLYRLDFHNSNVSEVFTIHEFCDNWLTYNGLVSYYPMDKNRFRISLIDFNGDILLDRLYNRNFLSDPDTFSGFWYCGTDHNNIYYMFLGLKQEFAYVAIPVDGGPLKVLWHEK